MDAIRVVDVIDEETFRLLPPCADAAFDHRSCDFWEDTDRGSKAARPAWIQPRSGQPSAQPAETRQRPANPFLADLEAAGTPAANPFAAGPRSPFLYLGEEESDDAAINPFASPPRERWVDPDAPRKLHLLARGLGVAGSYAKVLLRDEVPAAYAQFGPLTAYPRAQRTRDLYPALPDAPLPAVITCIASTAEARHLGLARQLVEVVCADLRSRGFTAVETYPEVERPDATSAASPAFWETVGFLRAIDDARFPVMRREFA